MNSLTKYNYRFPPLLEGRVFLWNLSQAEMVQSKEAITLGHILLMTHKINQDKAQMLTDTFQSYGGWMLGCWV